jgi:ribosomal protein L19E
VDSHHEHYDCTRDNEEGAGRDYASLVHPRRARLKHADIHLISILKLDAMMRHYQSVGLIDGEQYQRYLDYVKANRAEELTGED